MPLVHVLSGLPGSGKTTRSFEIVDRSSRAMVRTSLDDIRDMFGFSPSNSSTPKERLAKEMENAIIRAAVLAGRDVVIDNCNLNPAGPLRILEAVKGVPDIYFVVHNLTHVPLRTCVERDAKREDYDPVGPEIIKRLFGQFRQSLDRGFRLTTEWMNDPNRVVPATPPKRPLPGPSTVDL